MRLTINLTSVSARNGTPLLGPLDATFAPGLNWITGDNGAGKSTLCKLLAGVWLRPGSPLRVNGRLSLQGRDGSDNISLAIAPSARGDAYEWLSRVAYLGQYPGQTLIAIHYADNLCFPAESYLDAEHRARGTEIVTRLDQLFGAVPFVERRVTQLSYGERRKCELASIASMLLTKACVAVLDEPFSSLDDIASRTLCDAIRSDQFRDVTWIVASHESAAKWGLSPSNEFTLMPIKADSMTARIRRAAQSRLHARPRAERRASADGPATPIEFVRLEGLAGDGAKSFLNITFRPSALTWIVGINGSGKTTLLEGLAGLHPSRSWLRRALPFLPPIGADCRRYSASGGLSGGSHRLAPQLGIRLLTQNPRESFLHSRLCEESSRTPYHSKAGSDPLTAHLNLAQDERERSTKTFSFGELRLLQLFMVPPETSVLLFDEPLLGLSRPSQLGMIALLRRLAASGCIVVASASGAQVALLRNIEQRASGRTRSHRFDLIELSELAA